MLTDTEEVEPNLVRQLPFDDDLSKRFGLREQPPASVDGDISERVHTQFNRGCHVPPVVQRVSQ